MTPRTLKQRLLFASLVGASFIATVAFSSWRAGLWQPARAPPAAAAPLPAAPPVTAHYTQLDERHGHSRRAAWPPTASAPENDPQANATSAFSDSEPATATTTDEFLAEQDDAAARSSRAR